MTSVYLCICLRFYFQKFTKYVSKLMQAMLFKFTTACFLQKIASTATTGTCTGKRKLIQIPNDEWHFL